MSHLNKCRGAVPRQQCNVCTYQQFLLRAFRNCSGVASSVHHKVPLQSHVAVKGFTRRCSKATKEDMTEACYGAVAVKG